MSSAHPAHPMCPLCVLDQDHVSTTYVGDGVWLHTCDNPKVHGDKPFSWQETPDGSLDDLEYGGLTEEWGVYDDLLACFTPGEPFLEYGIIEHRYKHKNPERYAFLVDRYKHTKLGPHRYTASSFLGAALGRMLRGGDLLHQDGQATGYWHYNHKIGYWTRSVADPSTEVLTWKEFAIAQGLDPEDWMLTADALDEE
jgi:hypothetical protein